MVEEDLGESEFQQTITICLLSLVLVISPIIIFLVRNATETIQVCQKETQYKLNECKCCYGN